MPFDDSNTLTNSAPTPTPAPTLDPANATGESSQSMPQTQGPASTPSVSANNGPQAAQPGSNQNGSPQQIVSNTQPTQDANANHPLVKHAGVVNSVARALAGNPTRSVIDADGNRRTEPVPLTKGSIAMALALSAISGSLTGLQAGRGKGMGAAGAAAFQSAALRQQQQQTRQDEQAQQDFANRAAVLTRKAQIAEVNSRTLLNTAESEKYGIDAIDKLVEINRASGILDIDPGNLDNNGLPMTQAEMLDAMRSHKLSGMDQLGPVAGRVQVTNPDGSTRWEATHLIIHDPSEEVPLTQAQWDRFAAAGVPGFKAGVQIAGPNGKSVTEFKLSTIQRANEIAASHALSDFRLKDMRNVLSGTQYASQVPASIDFSKPGIDSAMQRFQKYVSHANQHGMDVYESLQQMGADKRDPKTGQMQPNPDSRYIDVVAGAFGGYPLLEAVHNQLAANKKLTSEFGIVDSEAKANAVIASPQKFTQDQVSSAQSFLKLTQQQGAAKAAQDARARAVAEGKDVEQMLKTGTNPITGEKLSLDNAPDSMLVDGKGRPVPQNMQSFYKPSGMEKQTADTARQAIAISTDLRAAVQKNPSLVGPLLGNSKSGLAKLGLGDAQAQKFLDDISFLQSASTKVHTGRFSSEILHKMGNMIKPGMNADQFVGGLNSIDEIMQRYSKEDQLVTVADYKQMQSTPASVSNTQSPPASLLKEGVNTTFGNGQTWTLRNGQAQQVVK